MVAVVRAVAVLLAALLAASAAPAAQNDASTPHGPIPYTQLRRTAGVPAAHPHRPTKPKPKPHPATAPPQPGAPAPPPGAPTPGVPATPGLSPLTSGAPAPAVAPGGPPAPTPPLAAPRPTAETHPAPPPPAAPVATPAPAGARLAPGAPPSPAELEAFVDGAVARGLRDGHGVGAAVAVVGGGQVLFEKGYGYADLQAGVRVDPRRTVFRLGSASRLLTAVEVLRQVEAGRLKLDAPVDAGLPPALGLPAEGFARPVRLGDVLRHLSGLESRELGRAFVPLRRVRALDAALRHDRPHRVREAGVLAVDGDYPAALAGAAAAHAAGSEFEALMERELLDPAGLGSTSFREPRPAVEGLPAPLPVPLADRMARGYGWSRSGLTARPYGLAGGLAPALSASTTADDMARLMLAELAGGRRSDGAALWGAATQARLHALGADADPRSAPYGRLRARLPGGFAGFGEAGAAPGFRVRYLVAPQLGLGVFVAVTGEGAGALADGLGPDLVARFYGPLAAPATEGGAEPGRFAGVYLDARRAYHGLEGFVDRTRRLIRVRPGGDGALAVFGEGTAGRWTPAGGDDFRGEDGAALRFLGAGGAAAALVEPGRAFAAERVGWLHRPVVLAATGAVAVLAALFVLLGVIGRMGREDHRPTPQQAAATVSQALAAALWLGAAGAYGMFLARSGGDAAATQPWPDAWPNPWLVGASAGALAAAVLTAVQIAQLPGTWAEGRRLAGWAAGRKLRHTLTVLAFTAFAVVLAAWGALEPWSS